MRTPLMLLAFVAGALQGCIAIPLVESPQTPKGADVRSVVGDGDGGGRLKVGLATRDEVLSELGAPRFRSAEDAAMGFEYRVNSLFWISPLATDSQKAIWPMHPRCTPSYYYVFVALDERGVLQRWCLKRRFGFTGRDEGDVLWSEFVAEHNGEATAPR